MEYLVQYFRSLLASSDGSDVASRRCLASQLAHQINIPWIKTGHMNLSADRKFQPLWRGFTFCPKWDALLKTPGGGTDRYLLKVPSMRPTAWSTVPKHSSLFTSFPLLPFLFSPSASSPPFCPINCHCNPRPPHKRVAGAIQHHVVLAFSVL